ncbi:MAG: hypothetical protein V1663_00365 [archaeon]
MNIEFLMDEFQENDKKELDKIIETLNQKPTLVNRNTLALQRFTLALLGQYPKRLKVIKQEQVNLKNIAKKEEITEYKLETKPQTVTYQTQSRQPLQQIQQIQSMQVPIKLSIEEFMPIVPRPISLLDNIPIPQLMSAPSPEKLEKKEEKKELPAPKIIPNAPIPQQNLNTKQETEVKEKPIMNIPEAPKIVPAPSSVQVQQNNPIAPKPVTENNKKSVNEAPKPI